jgi:UDP-N-acetylglucosamine diphosphorylase/glucosamine-1-phosphate N-acetyltransferase
MDFNLFDDQYEHFLPLSLTRPVGVLRIGIGTIADKWQMALSGHAGFDTRKSLSDLFPRNKADLHINGRLIPDQNLVEAIKKLQPEQTLMGKNTILAYRSPQGVQNVPYLGDVSLLSRPTDLFALNDLVLKSDFKLITHGRKSQPLPGHCLLIGPTDQLFIEEGAQLLASTFNTTDGPIYIGHRSTVMEGCQIRGPFALGDGATLKMGAKIYGATTIGPACKVGGEVSNSVFFGFSNKAHDGFVGNSIIGEWCNLGADTNTSNLKNNYSTVKLWDYTHSNYHDSGLTFCGLIMGDHSKSAINTQFNTGTTVGAHSNIFGSGFPPKAIPSFAWGGAESMETFDFDKALEVARRVKARRSQKVDDKEVHLMRHIFDQSARFHEE